MKRFDFFELGQFTKAHKTDQGFLKAPMYATRVGVFKYLMPDGTMRRELRHPDQVFHKDSLETLKNVPITVRHPKEMLTTKNTKKEIVGTTGENITVEADRYVQVMSTLYDESAIRRVLDAKDGKGTGLAHVSAGYNAVIVDKPGVFNGEPYDVEQTEIRYNHVALVEQGRAGDQVKIRLDSESAILFDDNIKNMGLNIKGENVMKKIKIDGKDYEVSDELKTAFDSMMASNKKKMDEMGAGSMKKDAVDEIVSEIKESRDKAEAKADSLETVNKELTEKLTAAEAKTDSKAIREMILERKNVEAVALTVLADKIEKEEIKLDEMDSVSDIKKAVILEISPELDPKKLESAVYVDARFDAISEKPQVHKDSLKEALNNQEKKKEESAGKETKLDAREQSIKESKEMWKQPLSATSTTI